VSHIPKFGDADKSPAGDAHPQLQQETPHLQITGYLTLLQLNPFLPTADLEGSQSKLAEEC
jgi:hypothetical protein